MEATILILFAVAITVSLYRYLFPDSKYDAQGALVLSLVRTAVVAVEQATKGAEFQNLPRLEKNLRRVDMCHEYLVKLAAAHGLVISEVVWKAVDVMIEKEVAELPETRQQNMNTLNNWLNSVTPSGIIDPKHITPPAGTTHPSVSEEPLVMTLNKD